MSATARPRADGTKVVRMADDDYETPAWCVRSIWPHVRPVRGAVLDPCAGRGAIVGTLLGHPRVGEWEPLWPDVHARELDEGRFAQIPFVPGSKECCDWLEYDEKLRPTLILTNPPYKLALEFVQKAIEVQRSHGGAVCMLLRLNFLGGQERGRWLKDHLPDVYVLSRRPSFCTYVRRNDKATRTAGGWWQALHAAEVGVPLEIEAIQTDQDAEVTIAPSRVDAVIAWCAALPGWDGRPLTVRSGTDATEYAWFHWHDRSRARLTILEARP